MEEEAGLTATAARTDPAAFRRLLAIDCDGATKQMGAVLDPWQTADFEALDPGWRKVAGQPTEQPFMRAYLERARGHSKTTDFAVMVLWVLYASARKLSGVAAAADKDQAQLLRNAADTAIRLNPWLAEIIEVQRYTVINKQTGSTLTILASDAASSYGLTPDFVIIDELTHWKKRDLWDSLISSAAKRETCMVVVISNAGLGRGVSWQWDAREAARNLPGWYFCRQDGPTASWITPDRLAEQRQLLPGKAYQRLWLNEWTAETGDALDLADIDACTVLSGPSFQAADLPREFEYIAGLDLGLRNDHSALVVLAVDRQRNTLRVVRVMAWKPAEFGGQVSIESVYQACMEAFAAYRLTAIVFDPWQAIHLAERLSMAGVNMIEWQFNTKGLNVMATSLLDVFKNRRIEMYPDDGLIGDLMRLTIVERPQGFKLEAVSDEKGHADRATALAVAVPTAIAMLQGGLMDDQIEYLAM